MTSNEPPKPPQAIATHAHKPVDWNFVVTILGAVLGLATLLVGGFTLLYVIADHAPKPQLAIVFSNGSKELTMSGDRVGANGAEKITFSLQTRNNGYHSATNVSSLVVFSEEMKKSYTGNYVIGPTSGVPKSYNFVKHSNEITKRNRNDTAIFQFNLKPGIYTLATEIDCAECDNEFIDKLTLTVE